MNGAVAAIRTEADGFLASLHVIRAVSLVEVSEVLLVREEVLDRVQSGSPRRPARGIVHEMDHVVQVLRLRVQRLPDPAFAVHRAPLLDERLVAHVLSEHECPSAAAHRGAKEISVIDAGDGGYFREDMLARVEAWIDMGAWSDTTRAPRDCDRMSPRSPFPESRGRSRSGLARAVPGQFSLRAAFSTQCISTEMVSRPPRKQLNCTSGDW